MARTKPTPRRYTTGAITRKPLGIHNKVINQGLGGVVTKTALSFYDISTNEPKYTSLLLPQKIWGQHLFFIRRKTAFYNYLNRVRRTLPPKATLYRQAAQYFSTIR